MKNKGNLSCQIECFRCGRTGYLIECGLYCFCPECWARYVRGRAECHIKRFTGEWVPITISKVIK
jgi:hypothetical protein